MKQMAFIIFLLHLFFLQGEIQEIKISWNAYQCQSSCIQQTQQQFSAINGVKQLKINAPSGIADIVWNPSTPLSYEPFRYASAAVGFTITSMRVKVKGKVRIQEGEAYLISDSDGSRFHLIGPLKYEPGRYIPKYNLETHPLPMNTKNYLAEIENEGKSIVISGPLFLPNSYPLTLIAETIKEK